MSNPRTPLYDLARSIKGAGFTQEQVAGMEYAFDRAGIPKDGSVTFTMKNPDAFFKGVRGVTGNLDQTQVDVINDLLTSAAHWRVAYLGYGLATGWHEAHLKPIEEIGKGRGRSYGVAGARMKLVSPTPMYGGQIPYGRGLVQLTWCDNYEWADKIAAAAGLIKPGELLANFALALRDDIASLIMVQGMETGAFTGKKLSDYITTGTHAEYVAARRIINGTDRADMIAGYADKFKAAAIAGEWS